MASKNQRWLVDSGILRKKNIEEDPQELLVFGYSCKLFRDDEKAKMIDQGKHLIPWMGDNTLKIDRYDGRGALGDLTIHEPPSGGFDHRTILTEDEFKIEQMCDEERYRSLYNNDAEESMYHEEEMKRLQQALDSENTFSQVSYNYEDQESQEAAGDEAPSPKPSEGESQGEEDRAFVLPPELEAPKTMILPETQKLNAIITKTALFISRQGSQMEILIKAKQANNPQFAFLSIDGELHAYYKLVLEAIKSGKYNPEKPSEKEMSASEGSNDESDGYLHPSLAASSLSKIEAAPSIPSIQYKPSADCAYSMLVNKITGKLPPSKGTSSSPPTLPPPPPPPPTLSVPIQQIPPLGYYPPISSVQNYPMYPPAPQQQQQQYSHGPVIYEASGQNYSSSRVPMSQCPQLPSENSSAVISKEQSTPLLVPYGLKAPKPLSRPSFIVPPADIQIIIDKMASYVAKNGRDFESIVKAKGDSRFNFLELSHQYHGYYAHKLTIYEGGGINQKVLTEEELLRKQEPQEEKIKKLEELQKKQQRMEEVQKRVKMIQAKKKGDKLITTISFSIKKPKEGETVVMEKRSALPIEESDEEQQGNDDDDDDNENRDAERGGDENEEKNEAEAYKEEITKSIMTQESLDHSKIEQVSRREFNQEKEFVDLTDDILEDCQNHQSRNKLTKDDRFKNECIIIGRNKQPKITTSKERQLQLERKKKAAMFLRQIQTTVPTTTGTTGSKTIQSKNEEADSENEVHSIPSPSYEKPKNSRDDNSLMNRLKSVDFRTKRKVRSRSSSQSSSRSQSNSRTHSERHRRRRYHHKKHKKKRSSHKSYDSMTLSKSHHAKKSKKSSSSSSSSSSRQRSRSRSSSRRSQQPQRYGNQSATSQSDSISS